MPLSIRILSYRTFEESFRWKVLNLLKTGFFVLCTTSSRLISHIYSFTWVSLPLSLLHTYPSPSIINPNPSTMSSHSQCSSFTDLFLTIFEGVIAFLGLLIFVPPFIFLIAFFFLYFWEEYYRAAIYNWLEAHASEAWLSLLPEDDQDLEDQESSVRLRCWKLEMPLPSAIRS